MKRLLTTVAIVFAAVTLGGCGTVCNFVAPLVPPNKDPEDWPRIYGGIQMDAMGWTAISSSSNNQSAGEKGRLIFLLCLGPDVIASSIADTLSLPITVLIDALKHPEKYSAAKQSPGAGVGADSSQKGVNGSPGSDSTPMASEPAGKPVDPPPPPITKLLVWPDSGDGEPNR